jgi:hypothetical protein
MAEEKICFVIAPIGEEGSETRERSDQILEFIIEPAAKECGYERVERADSSPKPGMITSQIIKQFLDAPLVIADLTDYNPNVFYELAVRHAARKPVVQLIDREQRIPFDVGGMRVVFITHRDLAFANKAKKELIEQIKAAELNPDAADNPISTTVELRGLRQSGRSSDQVIAEILETVQRIERRQRDERASETALQTALGAMDPDIAQWRASMSGLIGGYPYRRLIGPRPNLRSEYQDEAEMPPTDVSGGPKSS